MVLIGTHLLISNFLSRPIWTFEGGQQGGEERCEPRFTIRSSTSRRMRCTFIFTFAFLLGPRERRATRPCRARIRWLCKCTVCNSRVGFDAVSQLRISRMLWAPYTVLLGLLKQMASAHARLRARLMIECF